MAGNRAAQLMNWFGSKDMAGNRAAQLMNGLGSKDVAAKEYCRFVNRNRCGAGNRRRYYDSMRRRLLRSREQ